MQHASKLELLDVDAVTSLIYEVLIMLFLENFQSDYKLHGFYRSFVGGISRQRLADRNFR